MAPPKQKARKSTGAPAVVKSFLSDDGAIMKEGTGKKKRTSPRLMTKVNQPLSAVSALIDIVSFQQLHLHFPFLISKQQWCCLCHDAPRVDSGAYTCSVCSTSQCMDCTEFSSSPPPTFICVKCWLENPETKSLPYLVCSLTIQLDVKLT